MQYVGHLDLHRSWERTFRRSGLPLEYSQGFHPQPHLHLACALPVGFTSQCELLDAWLEQEFPLALVKEALVTALPPGLNISDISRVDEREPALQTQVASAVYQIRFLDDIPDIVERIEKIVNAVQLPRVRHGKPYDLRPLIESIELTSPTMPEPPTLQVQLAARQGATGRPEELLDEFGIKFENTHVHREKLILTTN
jgi:radical SAM-linked protein